MKGRVKPQGGVGFAFAPGINWVSNIIYISIGFYFFKKSESHFYSTFSES